MDETMTWLLYRNLIRPQSTLAYVGPVQFDQPGLQLNPGTPFYDLGYGVRISGARSESVEFRLPSALSSGKTPFVPADSFAIPICRGAEAFCRLKMTC